MKQNGNNNSINPVESITQWTVPAYIGLKSNKLHNRNIWIWYTVMQSSRSVFFRVDNSSFLFTYDIWNKHFIELEKYFRSFEPNILHQLIEHQVIRTINSTWYKDFYDALFCISKDMKVTNAATSFSCKTKPYSTYVFLQKYCMSAHEELKLFQRTKLRFLSWLSEQASPYYIHIRWAETNYVFGDLMEASSWSSS